MKKSILLSFSLLISLVMFSQIKTTSTNKVLIGKVQHFNCYKKGDIYTFTYNDYKYTQINEYKVFNLSEEDFNSFYETIQNGFKEVPGNEVTVETPDDIFRLKYSKVMGKVNLQIYHMVNKNAGVIGLSKYLTSKSVIKLFGKKKK